MKYVLIGLLFLSVYGCGELASYDFSPHKNIKLRIDLNEANYFREHNATFLYFNLNIENNANGDIFFNPSLLQAKVNSTVSEATYYNSSASVMPERKILKKGKNNFNLYFVLPGITDLKPINDFEILNFGLDYK